MPEASPTVKNIRSLLGSLATLDMESNLVRNAALGAALDFSDNRGQYEDIQGLAERIADLPWEHITGDMAEEVHSALMTLRDRVNEVISFSPQALQGQDVVAKREEISRDTRDAIISVKQTVIPLVGFLVIMSDREEGIRSELQELKEATSTTSREILDEASGTGMKAKEALAEIEGILAAARTASGNLGTEKEADTFDKAAKRYDKAAFWWLLASVGSALVTIGAAFGLVLAWATDGDITNADVLQLVLVKAAMLAVLTYATITAVRLYRSNAHLAAVNSHRKDALLTFQTFVGGTASEDIKDQVLLAAARAAFGQTPTGLVSDKGDGGSMLEVLAGIANNMGRRS